jgi:hypothetical protein
VIDDCEQPGLKEVSGSPVERSCEDECPNDPAHKESPELEEDVPLPAPEQLARSQDFDVLLRSLASSYNDPPSPPHGSSSTTDLPLPSNTVNATSSVFHNVNGPQHNGENSPNYGSLVFSYVMTPSSNIYHPISTEVRQ